MDDPLGAKGRRRRVTVEGLWSVTDHQDTGLLAKAIDGAGDVIVTTKALGDKFTLTSAAFKGLEVGAGFAEVQPFTATFTNAGAPALGPRHYKGGNMAQTEFVGNTYTVVHGTYTLEGILDVKLVQTGGPEPEQIDVTVRGTVYTYMPDPLGAKGGQGHADRHRAGQHRGLCRQQGDEDSVQHAGDDNRGI